MSLPAIIIGSSGHAQTLVDLLRRQGISIIGFVSPPDQFDNRTIMEMEHIGTDNDVLSYAKESVDLINAVGSPADGGTRKRIFEAFRSKGYRFASAIHDSAVIATNVKMGEGVQIMAGAVVQTGCELGDNIILNTRCSVDHHCKIGNNCHVSPGATLSGSVTLGDDVHVGAGATIIQNIEIGSGSLVAAGAVVVESLPANSKVAGVPSRPMK